MHHRDSLGSDQLIRPGELGLMTAGDAIAHAEQSPASHPALLHGVQLWVALPDAARRVAPAWAHHAELPAVTDTGLTATVIMGSLAGAVSPGQAYSPLVGADVALDAGAEALLPLEPDFEHAVLAMSGSLEVDGVEVAPGAMLYLGCGRRDLELRSEPGRPGPAAGRRAVRRADRHVVELRRPHERGDRGGPRRLGHRESLRRRARLRRRPAARTPTARPGGSSPADEPADHHRRLT